MYAISLPQALVKRIFHGLNSETLILTFDRIVKSAFSDGAVKRSRSRHHHFLIIHMITDKTTLTSIMVVIGI